jgi:hypothetical protein
VNRFDDDLTGMNATNRTDDIFGVEQSAPVTAFLADLRALGQREPPTPCADLAALFAGASPIGIVRRRRAGRSRRRRMRFAVAAAAATTIGLTVVAAANDKLPQPAQRVVSRLVDVLTPFHVDPAAAPAVVPVKERPHDLPAPAASLDPLEPAPAAAAQTAPEPVTTQSPEPEDGAADASPTASGADGADSSSRDDADSSADSSADGGDDSDTTTAQTTAPSGEIDGGGGGGGDPAHSGDTSGGDQSGSGD